jgi:hypothetical protein
MTLATIRLEEILRSLLRKSAGQRPANQRARPPALRSPFSEARTSGPLVRGVPAALCGVSFIDGDEEAAHVIFQETHRFYAGFGSLLESRKIENCHPEGAQRPTDLLKGDVANIHLKEILRPCGLRMTNRPFPRIRSGSLVSLSQALRRATISS